MKTAKAVRAPFTKTIWILFLSFSWFGVQSQENLFRNPLDIPIQLAANFGEIRTDHFHTGYDIRTNGKTGYKVYAAAGGYVSRIKVSAYGFGNALYITHPNGYMTVYGHLDHFNEAISKFVKEQQYAKKDFEVELFPDAGKFPVKQGDLIAYSGNSGSSGGPHLHFEIRDASGESYPLNPARFLPLPDHRSPQMKSLFVYPLESCCGVQSPKSLSIASVAGRYELKNDSIVTDDSAIGLAIDAVDFLDDSGNDYGVYQLEVTLDEKIIFSIKLDRLNFANGRYLNAHIDYGEKKKSGKQIQKLFVMPGDRNTLYHDIVKQGIIHFTDTLFHHVQITASDEKGNLSLLNFDIRFSGKETIIPPQKNFSAFFRYDQPNAWENDSIKLNLPANVLYDGLYFQYSKENAQTGKYFSAIHHVHNEFTPLHSNADLYLLPRKIPPALKSKAIILYRTQDRKITAKTSRWEGNYLTTKIRDFGDYFVSVDTTAPKVSPIGIRQNQVVTQKEIRLSVSDNLSGITSYNAYLDGKWHLLEYDPKNDRMFCELDQNMSSGSHTLKVVVKDEVNNETVYLLNFKK